MGVYTEYLDRGFSMEDLTIERKKQLARISQLRGGRDVLVFASDLSKGHARITIDYSDLLPISDQLATLKGDAIDLILETPGGAGEIAEDIVRLLRDRYDDVAVIIPGAAKSAGTIMAMSGDEILMEPASALGPIDAQLQWQGKVFSAGALVEGLEDIKQETARDGALNAAYTPMLQGISPGEIQGAKNALMFTQDLVADWLARYKFKHWTEHSSSGKPVTDEERKARAKEIAARLCDHASWKTHGRSIKIADLQAMRLQITDYSKDADLAEAIRRYYTLLHMTFTNNIYKLFETPTTQIARLEQPQQLPTQAPGSFNVEVKCGKCGHATNVQANMVVGIEIAEGFIEFPKDNQFKCSECGQSADISDVRRQIESQAGAPII